MSRIFDSKITNRTYNNLVDFFNINYRLLIQNSTSKYCSENSYWQLKRINVYLKLMTQNRMGKISFRCHSQEMLWVFKPQTFLDQLFSLSLIVHCASCIFDINWLIKKICDSFGVLSTYFCHEFAFFSIHINIASFHAITASVKIRFREYRVWLLWKEFFYLKTNDTKSR